MFIRPKLTLGSLIAALVFGTAAFAQAPTPKETTDDAPITANALHNTLAFSLTDANHRAIITVMGDGSIGPNPQWSEACTAINQIQPTQKTYGTLAILRSLIAGYSGKVCVVPDTFPKPNAPSPTPLKK